MNLRFLKLLKLNSNKIPEEFLDNFNSEIERIDLLAARTVSVTVAVLVVLFALSGIDFLFTPQYHLHFLVLRILISACCGVLCYLSFNKKYHAYGKIISLVSLWLCGWAISVMIRYLGYESEYYAGLNLVYLGALLVPWPMKWALTTCLGIYITYLIPILIFDLKTINWKIFINNNQFQLFTIIIVSIASYLQTKLRITEILNRLQISKQKSELEQRDREKREFISNISHELKTPLALVIGNAELALENIPSDHEDLRKNFTMIHQAAFQLANHVDRIIAISNLDDPHLKLELQNYNYTGIVRNIFAQFEQKAKEEQICFTLNCPESNMVVHVDIVRIEEILINLIQNAFKFTPQGGTIALNVYSDKQYVYTEVIDNGQGIPQQKQEKIFERMFQADNVLSKRHGGMGLGLYICKRNIELHGGQITLHSVEGKGSTFRFWLPLYIDQSVQVTNCPFYGEERRKAPRRGGQDRRMEERRKLFEYQQNIGLEELAKMSYVDNLANYENNNPSLPSVLVVEDNFGMMKVVVEALRNDYNLFLAPDAYAGLGKLGKHGEKIALILSDIMLPGLNGFDFCKEVMEQERFRHIPFIFVTALISEQEQLRGFTLGATDYITKPYNIRILKEKVHHWISRRRYEMLLKEISVSLENKIQQVTRIKDIILHEIRNPLQIISGADYFLNMIESRQQNATCQDSFRRYLKMLHNGIEALHSVVETTSELDLENMTTRSPEKLGDLFNYVYEQTMHLFSGITFCNKLGAASEWQIGCDRRMIVQVLVNLIRNAIDAIKEKGDVEHGIIEIAASRIEKGHILLTIRDNGAGMDKEVQDRLFHFKFTTKKDGTGIGLHLSKLIIKLHNGSIWVESKKNKETIFFVSLPEYVDKTEKKRVLPKAILAS